MTVTQAEAAGESRPKGVRDERGLTQFHGIERCVKCKAD
jgi:hypothetical protein